MNNKGALVISLDFELLWGVFDMVDYRQRIEYFRNTRAVIPKILKLLKENQIHCTWATVGMLFNKNWKEWEENNSTIEPNYENGRLSSYRFGNAVKNLKTEALCFAPDLIREIAKVPGQEIGSHTYSHYYCKEAGQTLEEFKADLTTAIKMAEDFGFPLRSLVFPRNQMNREYLKVCTGLEITSVRSNPDVWYWKDPASEDLKTKLFRTGDAYNLLSSSKSYSFSSLKKDNDLPLEQPASRFLRPYETNSILHGLKMKKIFQEMSYAAKHGEIYHLWWHPHNFGESPLESLNDLSTIISHFGKLQRTYGFKSANMHEIYNTFLNNV
ncbi:Polysaccharide deacetylase [Salinimicrobium sediminis]|uniref:Polysaccharide deacetylase n=1 Tax=Salinimicrobium sediminis TaxID=1343891 RepID=A0A285X7D7_9FLAO|nr:polysaccharide deacetylase family protein [Salinimicrobium sediminis]SOC80319.1 Polysaccharide deacetylase [Salinimicrobium sediminis]